MESHRHKNPKLQITNYKFTAASIFCVALYHVDGESPPQEPQITNYKFTAASIFCVALYHVDR